MYSRLGRKACITSLVVLVVVQNNGGDSAHPICRLSGTRIPVSSSDCLVGVADII